MIGEKSYIGTCFTSFIRRIEHETGEHVFEIKAISVRDKHWKKQNFNKCDVILYTAGIVHQKETKKNKNLYFQVNRDLTIEIAKKAKSEGVKQFILLSTMNVYGKTSGIIGKSTIPYPRSIYGKSKLEADQYLLKIADESFKVTILRPPMVYGEGCKGNYCLLSEAARYFFIFPDYKNKRSMIYIENLSAFIKKTIDLEMEGIFLPQNEEYVCTRDLVSLIRKVHGKKTRYIKFFNRFLLKGRPEALNKIFGDLIYERIDISADISFEDSIYKTEK